MVKLENIKQCFALECNGVRHDRVCLYVTVAYVCMSVMSRACNVRVSV